MTRNDGFIGVSRFAARHAVAINMMIAVALTGCQGVYDAFNRKIPTQTTEPERGAESSDVLSSETSTQTTPVSDVVPRATRTSASGSYSVDPEASEGRSLGPTSNHHSGARIRAKVLVTDEGDRAFQGWFDSQRGEDCDFQRDTEGVMRCLPASFSDTLGDAAELSQFVAADYAIIAGRSRVKGYGLVAEDGATSTSSFYDENADLGCMWMDTGDAVQCMPQARRISHYVDQAHTRLLIQEEPEVASVTPNIGEHYHSSSCTSDYYRGGAPFEGDRVFPRDSRDSRPITQGESFYELGEPIAGDSFAGAVHATDPTDSGRLTAVYWTTPDGGAWFSHWYDNELETACFFTRDRDPRCVPKTDGVRTYYADAQCTDLVAEIFPESDCSSEVVPPRYVTVLDSDVSDAQVSGAYSVSSERALTTRYEKSSQGSCEPRVAPEHAHYFDLSEPVAASELAGGQIVVE